jgi:hypothetical protein
MSEAEGRKRKQETVRPVAIAPASTPAHMHSTPEALLHHLKSRAGEERERRIQEALAFWSGFVGVIPASLHQQVYQMFDAWGQARLLEAMDTVRRISKPRVPSREKFRLLVRVLRDWKRSAPK